MLTNVITQGGQGDLYHLKMVADVWLEVLPSVTIVPNGCYFVHMLVSGYPKKHSVTFPVKI